MEALALIIAIIALLIAILAYSKVGGRADLKRQTEALTKVGESITGATDSLRDKTADILDRMEARVRGAEERKEAAKPRGEKETEKSTEKPTARKKNKE